MLVPEVANGAAEELADVRDASFEAVTRLRLERPDLLIAVATGGGAGAREVRFGGNFRRFGVDLAVGEGATGDGLAGDGAAGSDIGDVAGDDGRGARGTACVGLLVGRWLLDGGFPAAVPLREGWEIGERTEPGECERIGRALAARSARVALLVMGDGTARRGVKAPGYLDERAVPFDDEVARALGGVDTRALAAIDPAAASDLMAAGRAPWQVLAGAVDGSSPSWRGELLSYRAPYGVGYFTAVWTPQG